MAEKFFMSLAKTFVNVIVKPVDKYLSVKFPYIPDNARNLWANYPEKKGRPMIYPYTHTACFVQFPYQYYFKYGWAYKYYLIAFLASLPIMLKITHIVSSPSNVAYWRQMREDWYGPNSYHG